MTNILAAVVVTLVTNVTNWDNHKGYESYPAMTVYGIWPAPKLPEDYGPFTAPTERYSKTEVSEQTTWTFHCPDKDRVVTESKLLSSVTKTQRLKSEWEDAGVRTNETAVFLLTNNTSEVRWYYTNGMLILGKGWNLTNKFVLDTNIPSHYWLFTNLDYSVKGK